MANLDLLNEHTTAFFERHLANVHENPVWQPPWYYKGSIPDNGKQGCYAVLRENEVIYIGVGAGAGTERYRNAGIGQRLGGYWRRHSTQPRTASGEYQYEPTERWQKVGASAIATIGFPEEISYLAYALEQYLIGKLNPELNVIGRRGIARPEQE